MNMRLQTAGAHYFAECSPPSTVLLSRCSRLWFAKPPPAARRLTVLVAPAFAGDEVNATMKKGLADLVKVAEHIGETFNEALGATRAHARTHTHTRARTHTPGCMAGFSKTKRMRSL